MADADKPPFKIELTPAQKKQIKDATGADVEALEVSTDAEGMAPETLEDRVAPAIKIVIKGTFVF
jgi:hypothetical protein